MTTIPPSLSKRGWDGGAARPVLFCAETEALIQTCFNDHKGLIVCPNASPYIRNQGKECFEQYKTMIDTVLQE